MKIVQVVNNLSVSDGGPARNSFELNRALNREKNCSANLFWVNGDLAGTVFWENGAEIEDLPSPGPRKISLRENLEGRKASLFAFVRSLAQSDVVILHGYYLPWVPIVSSIGRALGCRVFLMPHGSLTARQQKYSQRNKKIFDLTLGWITRKGITAFVTGTPIERDELVQKFPRSRVEVAAVGVPVPSIFKNEEIVHGPIRLLSMSRIAAKKRIDLSIDALGRLNNAGIPATLTIAGTGPEALVSRLQSQADQLGVGASVSFVGQVSGQAKSRAYLQSDVFLLPSEDENFGIGFAEATSYGLPTVVSSQVAAAAELPRAAGIVIDNPDGDTIANAVQILTSEEAYLTAQAASRDFALRQFSWATAARRWISVLDA